MTEIWREVFSDSGYFVSNLGRVKSKERKWPYKKKGKTIIINAKERLLSATPQGNGYLCVRLKINGKGTTFLIHRLVAFSFVKMVDGKNCVNHLDGNKENNNALNLEWCTQRENVHHAQKMGLFKSNGQTRDNDGVYIYYEKERNIFRSFHFVGKKRKYIKQSANRDIVERAVLKYKENL